MNLLVDLTLRGSAAIVMILLLERLLGSRISSRSRRLWWCILPLAFLVPLRVPVFPALGHLASAVPVGPSPPLRVPPGMPADARPIPRAGALGLTLWLAGAVAYFATVGWQTVRAGRRWSRERSSTDPALLELLADCKAEAGVAGSVGLVVSRSVASPVFMGWLRPRIFLPESIVAGTSPSGLRPILLHELAHLRWHDIPFNWLLTAVRAVHWFNPLVHLGAISWSRFREEAADEAAIRWMRDESGAAYGEALLHSLRLRQSAPTPFGSLAIVESAHHLKKRILMINRYKKKTSRIFLTGLGALSMIAIVCSISARADESHSSDPTVSSIAAAQRFFWELDAHQWAAVWHETTARLQIVEGTEGKFIALMEKSSRAHFGKCLERKLIAVTYKTDPEPDFKGDYAYAYFDASFEDNPTPQREYAIFKREADGSWKNDSWAYDDRDRTQFLPK